MSTFNSGGKAEFESEVGIEAKGLVTFNLETMYYKPYTEVEVFMDKRVRETRQRERGNTSNKKVRDFTDPFIHKSTLLSTRMSRST